MQHQRCRRESHEITRLQDEDEDENLAYLFNVASEDVQLYCSFTRDKLDARNEGLKLVI